jgi:hypothetical protein
MSLHTKWRGDKSTLFGVQSWNEFVTEVSRRAKGGARGCGESSQRYGDSFTGTNTFEDAIKLARDGWVEGAQQVAAQLDALPPEIECLPDWRLEPIGAMVCVPAVVSGEPECMWYREESARAGRQVAIVVYGSYSGCIPKSEAMNYACNLAALMRALEASGVDTALYITCAYQDYSQATVVREFGEPMDLAKIAFCMHPSYLRRLYFAYGELTADRVARGIGSSGYGGSAAGGYIAPDATFCEALIGPGNYCCMPPLNTLANLGPAAMMARMTATLSEFIKGSK